MQYHVDQQIVSLLSSQNLPKYEEIPDVGLYRDQVTKYVNAYFEKFPNLSITNSMISNYVKQGLLPKCEKKLYRRDHIMRLIMIVFGKEVLSTEDLKQLFELQVRSYPNDVAYNYFLLELDNVSKYICGIQDEMRIIGKQNTAEKNLLRNTVIALTHKLYITLSLKCLKKEED